MNEHALKVLEYEKVKSLVASYAASEAGRIVVRRLHPTPDGHVVAALLSETREFTAILQLGEKPPLDGIPETGQAVAKLGVSNSMLSPAELLNLALTLGSGRRVKKFFQRFEGKGAWEAISAPLLAAKASEIRPLKEIEEAILGAIDDKAEVRDSASPELRKIRRQLMRMRESILDRMHGILQDSGLQKVIQEPVITLRDDRYVLPLKPNFRQSLSGVVHGQSGSRATLFVEPLDILEQNNRLAELRMEEREEVERILRELTSLLSRESDAVRRMIDALAYIDAVYARARFGLEYDATVPCLSADGSIRLRSARHPLLVAKYKSQAGHSGITPNDILLAGGQRALILSGPNAGGKTAVLKTAGLLCLMAQSGIPITGAEGSEVPCFASVFADIGDDQSLEQDLSTFSSHVSRIAEILREADGNSLVLLDELGSGTEPGEGAGLGAAVLEDLLERGCVTIVTTHQNALKLFGSRTSGAVNAAMEFDPQSLTPTYRLIAGRPGRSYGLDMASRMGIPAEVIRNARSRISDDDVSLDQLLRQVEEESRLVAAERLSLEQELIAARRERTEAVDALRAARDEAREVKAKARTEAREVLSALRQKLRELSRIAALDRTDIKKTSGDVEGLGSRLEPAAHAEQTGRTLDPRDFHVGETVRIERLNKTGTVVAWHGGILDLEVGAKKIRIPSKEVVPLDGARGERPVLPAPGWNAEFHEEEGAADRLNIIGLRVPEGLAEVDRFIDRAGLHQVTVLTIIHGLGTGALKTAVAEFLRNHPLIAATRPGEPAEGGAGVTIAELKK